MTLTTPVRFLKGIGPSRSGCLERLGVQTVRDALLLVPRRYEDRRALLPIGRLRLGEFQAVAGRVKAVGAGRTRRGVPYCEVMLEDGTGTLLARWYRQPYLTRTFRRGQRVLRIAERRCRRPFDRDLPRVAIGRATDGVHGACPSVRQRANDTGFP